MKEYITLVSHDTGQEYQVRLCKSFIERFMGYMYQKIPREPALLFEQCKSIHMFGMRFPLDVLFLDKNYEIIKRIDNLQPRRIVWPVHDATMVLEAPVGTFQGLTKGMCFEYIQ